MCVGKNKNNFSGCFLLNFPKFRFKTAVKIGLQVTSVCEKTSVNLIKNREINSIIEFGNSYI